MGHGPLLNVTKTGDAMRMELPALPPKLRVVSGSWADRIGAWVLVLAGGGFVGLIAWTLVGSVRDYQRLDPNNPVYGEMLTVGIVVGIVLLLQPMLVGWLLLPEFFPENITLEVERDHVRTVRRRWWFSEGRRLNRSFIRRVIVWVPPRTSPAAQSKPLFQRDSAVYLESNGLAPTEVSGTRDYRTAMSIAGELGSLLGLQIVDWMVDGSLGADCGLTDGLSMATTTEGAVIRSFTAGIGVRKLARDPSIRVSIWIMLVPALAYACWGLLPTFCQVLRPGVGLMARGFGCLGLLMIALLVTAWISYKEFHVTPVALEVWIRTRIGVRLLRNRVPRDQIVAVHVAPRFVEARLQTVVQVVKKDGQTVDVAQLWVSAAVGLATLLRKALGVGAGVEATDMGEEREKRMNGERGGATWAR